MLGRDSAEPAASPPQPPSQVKTYDIRLYGSDEEASSPVNDASGAPVKGRIRTFKTPKWVAGKSPVPILTIGFADGGKTVLCVRQASRRMRDEIDAANGNASLVDTLLTKPKVVFEFYDSSTGDLVRSIDGPELGAEWAMAAISPDGSRVALQQPERKDGNVLICDSQTGQIAGELAGHRFGVNEVAFSPTGRYVATSAKGVPSLSSERQPHVCLWDAASGQRLHDLPIESGPMAFSPDEKYILTHQWDFDGKESKVTLSLWDVAAGRRVERIAVTDSEYRVAFLSDNQIVTAGWRPGTGEDARLLIRELSPQEIPQAPAR